MENNSQYRGWMAEQIAKAYLYETQLLDIYLSDNREFDILCIFKNNVKIIFAVDVKSSQYTKSQIFMRYKKDREKHINNNFPILMLYINYVDKTGYFEFIRDKLNNDLYVLTTENLKLEINNLTR